MDCSLDSCKLLTGLGSSAQRCSCETDNGVEWDMKPAEVRALASRDGLRVPEKAGTVVGRRHD